VNLFSAKAVERLIFSDGYDILLSILIDLARC